VHGIEFFIEGYGGSGVEVFGGDDTGSVFPGWAVEGVGSGWVVFSGLEMLFHEGLGVVDGTVFIVIGIVVGGSIAGFGWATWWHGGLKPCDTALEG